MKLLVVTFALLFPFYYNSLAKLLTGDQSHLAGVLHACSRKDDFKKFWAKKEKFLRVYGGFCAFFGFFGTLIDFIIVRKSVLAAVGGGVAFCILGMSLGSSMTLLEALTKGHIEMLADLQSEILQIVSQEKVLEGETIQTTVSLDELVERNAKSMALSNSSVPTYSIILTLCVFAGFCLMILNQNLPSIQIGDPGGIFWLLLLGPALLYMLKLAADLISLLATLGQRYNHLVSSFAGDENCISCKKRYDDPMALRSMFDNIERKKEHVWVLFSHPLDDTLVWGILTYLGVSLLILWVSGM